MSTEVQLARIEENLNHVKENVQGIASAMPGIVKKQAEHGTEIALLKRDNKWRFWIFSAVATLLGMAATVAAELIKR